MNLTPESRSAIRRTRIAETTPMLHTLYHKLAALRDAEVTEEGREHWRGLMREVGQMERRVIEGKDLPAGANGNDNG